MEERVLEILAEINDEILEYDGDSLVESGLLDSFQIVDLVGMLEEEFDIEIDAELDKFLCEYTGDTPVMYAYDR